MYFLVMGCGSSVGVPAPFCYCSVCLSSCLRNNRSRSSAILNYNGKNILIDIGPDFRSHVISNKIEDIDAILITHCHYDHIVGLVDLRAFCSNMKKCVKVFMSQVTFDTLCSTYGSIYCCIQKGMIDIDIVILEGFGGKFNLFDLEINYFSGKHGGTYSTGFVFDKKIAYLTDMSIILDENLDALSNVTNAVVGANYWEVNDKSTHLGVRGCLDLCKKFSISNLWMTHLGHEIDYEDSKLLPPWAHFAYDGLKLDL